MDEEREWVREGIRKASREMFLDFSHENAEKFRNALKQGIDSGLCDATIDYCIAMGRADAKMETEEQWRM